MTRDIEISVSVCLCHTLMVILTSVGIRGVITLYNRLNYPADFTWNPILGDRGTAFSIRPATGTVEPLTDLDCEVVFHPSYIAPEEGQFALQVHGGETSKLDCIAKVCCHVMEFQPNTEET